MTNGASTSSTVPAPAACSACHDQGHIAPPWTCKSHGYAACPFCAVDCSCEAGLARAASRAHDGRQMTLDDAARATREGTSVAAAGFANFADALPYDGEAAE